MKVIGRYSFNDGEGWFRDNRPGMLAEIGGAIQRIDASQALTKVSEEANRNGELLYEPAVLNNLIKAELSPAGWAIGQPRISLPRLNEHYEPDYEFNATNRRPGALIGDFWKDQVGIEVQFGKYSFTSYDILAKMAIFRKHGLIEAGVEIVPSHELRKRMSSGIGTFEQIIAVLVEAGVTERDLPVVVFGIEF